MEFSILVILIIAAIMGFTDYFGHKISGLAGGKRDYILSFSAGVLISLLFLILIPDLVSNGPADIFFFFMLLGFSLMHLSEKYIYKHVLNKQELLKDLKIIHIIGFGIDNFLVGFIIASVLEIDLTLALYLSIPLFMQMLTSSISLDSLDIKLNDKISKILLSVLPFLGAITGLILENDPLVANYVLAFVIGVLFYMIIRDVIPQGKAGYPLFFLIGMMVSIALWLARVF
jgi:zinc transporter ZupT